jgi:hypothetical protein
LQRLAQGGHRRIDPATISRLQAAGPFERGGSPGGLGLRHSRAFCGYTGNIMSRGFGRLERMILAAVEAGWPPYLIDLLPVAHTRAQAVALERAARHLAREGKINLGYDRGKLVILKPSKCSQGSAPTWDEREQEADWVHNGDASDWEVDEYLWHERPMRAWRQGESEDQEDKADREAADRVMSDEMGNQEWYEEHFGDDD